MTDHIEVIFLFHQVVKGDLSINSKTTKVCFCDVALILKHFYLVTVIALNNLYNYICHYNSIS